MRLYRHSFPRIGYYGLVRVFGTNTFVSADPYTYTTFCNYANQLNYLSWLLLAKPTYHHPGCAGFDL